MLGSKSRAPFSSKIEKERILVDGVLHRLSVQHAHPLGPWQAMLGAVKTHYNQWEEAKAKKLLPFIKDDNDYETAALVAAIPFRVLDLACGPRGEPGTTIAHALPLAAIHCTDSCSVAVAAIPIFVEVDNVDGPIKQMVTTQHDNHPCPAPTNLTKSVTDLTDLSSYDSNTFDAIICCYGYALSLDISHALTEAHRVLKPGGVLVIVTWERSAMLSIGRDVLAFVRGGGRDQVSAEDDEAFLPPRMSPPDKMELSGVGELEGLLVSSGFDHPRAVVATMGHVYPFDLGNEPNDQFAMGTILEREELERLGALGSDSGDGAGGWGNLAEEAFWTNIQKYVDMVEGTMFLKDNAFKLTISTK